MQAGGRGRTWIAFLLLTRAGLPSFVATRFLALDLLQPSLLSSISSLALTNLNYLSLHRSLVSGLSDDTSSLSPRPHSLASAPSPLPLLGTRSTYYLFKLRDRTTTIVQYSNKICYSGPLFHTIF